MNSPKDKCPKMDVDDLIYRFLRDKGLTELEARSHIKCNALYRERGELQAELHALRAEVEQLRTALIGLSMSQHIQTGEYCFCGVAIGNPMVTDHDESCRAAQTALAQTKEKE